MMEIIANVKNPESIVVTIQATMTVGQLNKLAKAINRGLGGGNYEHHTDEFRTALMDVSRKAHEHFRSDTEDEKPF